MAVSVLCLYLVLQWCLSTVCDCGFFITTQHYSLIKKQLFKCNKHPRITKIPSSGLKVIKLFSCSTQLSTEYILLINVKMPTIVGILTFIIGILTLISMINTTSERLKPRNFFICQYFSLYQQLEFRAQLS